MDRGIALTVAVAALALLAGCSGTGGGGGGGSSGTVDLVDPTGVADDAVPGQPVSVSGEASDGTIDHVNLTYTVRNRSRAVVAEDTVRMSPSGDQWTADIPAQPAGYKVSYEIRGYFEDGSQDTESASYIVQYIESVSGPTEEVTDQTSDVEASLYSTDGIDRIELEYKRTFATEDETETGEIVRRNPTDETLSFGIQNDQFGRANSDVTVEYRVRVTYEAGGEPASKASDWQSYTYVDNGESALYVPVTFQGGPNTEPPVQSELTTRAEKTQTYYEQVSDGRVDVTYDWATNSSADPYYTLPDARGAYRTGQNNQDYDREKVMCDGVSELRDAGLDGQLQEYDDVVFVVAEQNDDFVRGLASYSGPGCGLTGVSTQPFDTVVVSAKHPYSTWAHEMGHALYRWDDYYGDDVSGQTQPYGIMSDSRNADHAAIPQPRTRLEQDWRDVDALPLVNDSNERSETDLDWLARDGNVARYDPDNEELIGGPIYDRVLFSARDTNVDPVPSQGPDAQYTGGGPRGVGINAYLVSDELAIYGSGDAVHRIENPDSVLPGRTVSLRSATDDVIRDPDLGYNVTADTSAGGASVVVRTTDPQNVQGVNLYTLFPCQDRDTASTSECQDAQNPGAPRALDGSTIDARFESDSGTLGRFDNGTVRREVDGGTYLEAGGLQKLYAPTNASGSFLVNASTERNVTVLSRTVTRDDSGRRIASGLRRVNVTAGSTYQPELARLNASRDEWEAGGLRTLESNETTLRIENDGIRSLENVSLATTSEWVSLNRTDVGTVQSASEVPVRVAVDVPSGTPVGTYNHTVEVSGEGTSSAQRDRIDVSVTVLPTARWETTLSDVDRIVAANESVTVEYRVKNDESSNVPLRDVRSRIAGNVTAFDVAAPRHVEELQPGTSERLRATASVPESGIAAGLYEGRLSVSPLGNYTKYTTYSVAVPANYSVARPASRNASITLDARGPSTNSSATFHPERQVAMRRGAATERVTVDVVGGDPFVRSASLRTRIDLPEGWALQSRGPSDGPERSATIWAVSEGPRDTPAGRTGQRTRLDAANYTVVRDAGALVVAVNDTRETSLNRRLTPSDRIEVEFKVNKRQGASEYEYSSEVETVARSPIGVVGTETVSANISVFYPGAERSLSTPAATPVASHGPPARVPAGHVRVGTNGRGQNATLSDPRRYAVDYRGEPTTWVRHDLTAPGRDTARNVWVRTDDLTNETHEISADDTVVVPGLVTRNVRGAIASGLRNGRPIAVEVPVTDAVADREAVSVEGVAVSTENESTRATLETKAGEPVARMNASVSPSGDAQGISVARSVTVGEGVFETGPVGVPPGQSRANATAD